MFLQSSLTRLKFPETVTSSARLQRELRQSFDDLCVACRTFNDLQRLTALPPGLQLQLEKAFHAVATAHDLVRDAESSCDCAVDGVK